MPNGTLSNLPNCTGKNSLAEFLHCRVDQAREWLEESWLGEHAKDLVAMNRITVPFILMQLLRLHTIFNLREHV